MLIAILFLYILPVMVGTAFGTWKHFIELHVKGTMLLFSLFSTCYYVVLFLLRSNSLSLLIRIYFFALIPTSLWSLWKMIRIRSDLTSHAKEVIISIKKDKAYLILAMIPIGFQLLRIAIGTPSQYRDSTVYDPLVTGITGSGFIYAPWGTTSFVPEQLIYIDSKYITTPWYVYEAAISCITRLHPLVITRTLIPISVFLLAYMALYLLSKELFHDTKTELIFLFLCSLLYEARLILGEQAAYLLIWPCWGKSFASVISCVLIAAWVIKIMQGNTIMIADFIWLFFFSFAGAGTTATTIMTIPVEMGALALAYMVTTKDICRPIAMCLSGIMPCLFQFSIYWIYTHHLLDKWFTGVLL